MSEKSDNYCQQRTASALIDSLFQILYVKIKLFSYYCRNVGLICRHFMVKTGVYVEIRLCSVMCHILILM
jgi:hypothetical protein